MRAHIHGAELFVQDLYAGADPAYRLNVRVITELAWHGLFIRHLLRRPARDELAGFMPGFTILNCPSFQADPARHGCRSETVIAISFEQKLILIGGTAYAGENKKSVFTVLNYLLPEQGVMPMHCSANHGRGDPDDVALFFGLSGTGKTTLSADPERVLIGDDEHGWSDDGHLQLRGRLLRQDHQPLARGRARESTRPPRRFGTIVENMVYDPVTRVLDFADDSLTANTRCAYPLEAISNASPTSRGGEPRNVVMLTCDAFGVLPPIARLTPAQAMYHFLSGFTSKVAGTERGVTEPQPTFSTCFGAPFMPRRPEVYGALLARPHRRRRRHLLAGQHRLDRRRLRHRPAHADRRDPRAAHRRARRLARPRARFRRDPTFGFEVPVDVPGVDAALLDPRSHLGRPRRLRRPGGEARRDVRRELRPVRGPRLRRRAGRRGQRRLILRRRRTRLRARPERARCRLIAGSAPRRGFRCAYIHTPPRHTCTHGSSAVNPPRERAQRRHDPVPPRRLAAVERGVGARHRLRQRRRPRPPARAPPARR